MSTFNTSNPAQDASIWPSAIKWGAIGGFIGVMMTMLYYNMGLMEPTNPSGSILSTIISLLIGFAIIYLGVKTYRDTDNQGSLTLGRGMFWSLGYALVAGLIGAIFSFVFFSFLAPDFIAEMLELQIAELEEQGLGEEEMESALYMMGIFMSPASFAIMGFLGQVFWTAIEGLIASLILKTR